MANKDIRVLHADNAQILNAIRTDASLAYQQRVPAATQGNITATVEALTEYKPMMNEFVDGLVNRIGDVVIKSKTWTNPLAEFKRGMMQYGETIEELATTLLKAKRYDVNNDYSDVFKVNAPEVMSNFHSINRADMYELSVNDIQLRRAFLNDYGLQDLVGRIMETPYTSDYWDEYLIMRNLFAEYNRIDGFYKVEVPDIAAATTRQAKEDAGAAITEAVRAQAGKMRFLSGNYNAGGAPTFTNPDDLVIFATPEFVASLDVNLIAFAFNASAAALQSRIVLVDDFGIDGCQAILCDKDFFMCADTLINFESIRNPKWMGWNYFLNHQGIYSVSRFVNAVMFTTEAGSMRTVPTIKVTDVDVSYMPLPGGDVPTYAVKGAKTRLAATVNGTVSPETPGYVVPQGVEWEIVESDKPLAMGTQLSADGILTIAPEQEGAYVTVKATSTFIDPKQPASGRTPISGTLKVGIGEIPTITVTGVTIKYRNTGTTGCVKGQSVNMVATVAGTVVPQTSGYSVPQNVAWTIDTASVKSGTYIDASGLLHVDAAETVKNVTVRATSPYVNPKQSESDQTIKTATMSVPVLDKE